MEDLKLKVMEYLMNNKGLKSDEEIYKGVFPDATIYDRDYMLTLRALNLLTNDRVVISAHIGYNYNWKIAD
jgi:hypothetical protein